MSIHQSISINASPKELYDTLTLSSEFAAATGAPATIGTDAGAEYSCFGGQITGRQLELIPSARIVQAWRAEPWPEGVFSVVRFDLEPEGAATKVTLTHTGYPEGADEHLSGGWQKMYWDPLIKFFE